MGQHASRDAVTKADAGHRRGAAQGGRIAVQPFVLVGNPATIVFGAGIYYIGKVIRQGSAGGGPELEPVAPRRPMAAAD